MAPRRQPMRTCVACRTERTKRELVRVVLKIHRAASEYAMATRPAFIEMAMQKLGQKRDSIEQAAPNVELTWNMDETFVAEAHYYALQMKDRKQIRELPADYDKFLNVKFVRELGP